MAAPRKKVPSEIKTLMHPSRNPEENIERAKHRAAASLGVRRPKLTALEKGFYRAFKSGRLHPQEMNNGA
jgi:hypothetical protein